MRFKLIKKLICIYILALRSILFIYLFLNLPSYIAIKDYYSTFLDFSKYPYL